MVKMAQIAVIPIPITKIIVQVALLAAQARTVATLQTVPQLVMALVQLEAVHRPQSQAQALHQNQPTHPYPTLDQTQTIIIKK